jgi:hypothetical protein
MFDSDILEVCIGVVFVFVLVSTICSAIREGIEAYMKTRASYLEYGIRQLLADCDARHLALQFFNHPLVSGLSMGKYDPKDASSKLRMYGASRELPSYIPSRNFALAIMDIVARGPQDVAAATATSQQITLDSLRANVANLGDPKVQRVLLAALDSAQGDLNRVQASLEAWYDGAMERVSGWYKRTTQKMLFVIALVVAVTMNINTITVADYLFRHDTARSVLVASIEKSSASPAQPGASPDSAKAYAEAKRQLDAMHLPIGWTGRDFEASWGAPRTRAERAVATPADVAVHAWDDILAPILGWLLTAFAATLGAPFWFDVLSKVTTVRSTVKPREKATSSAQVAATPTTAGLMTSPTTSADALDGEETCGVGAHGAATPDHRLPVAEGGVR